jgi:predicted metal-dependent phosphoesterase TrpH
MAVENAHEAGLAAISIADHDSVNGVEAAIRAGRRYGVEVIPGVELSSEFEGQELHILGYFIDWRDKWFRDKLLAIQEARVDRAKRILERLRDLNINISYNTVIVIAGGVVGRPHIAQVLLDRNYVRTVQEAFEKYLGISRPAYVGKYPLSPAQAIGMIRRVGGIPALAHPLFTRVDEVLPKLVDQGLQALEVYHSRHDATATGHFEELARKYDLLVVGGSDAHGREVPVGAVRIPYEFVEKLKEELASRGSIELMRTQGRIAEATAVNPNPI